MSSTDLNRRFHRIDGQAARGDAPRRVLVVDDDPLTLETVGQMVQLLGFQVDLADGADAARKNLEKSRYDLMLTDLQMPHMDGIMLITWLKQRMNHTRAVIMTGRRPEEVSEYGKQGLADDWLHKPFDLDRLRVVLNRLL